MIRKFARAAFSFARYLIVSTAAMALVLAQLAAMQFLDDKDAQRTAAAVASRNL